MRSDKGKAFVLRREGLSYREISERLEVSKGTLSNWFKGVDFSEAIKTELTKQANKQKRTQFQELNRVRGVKLAVEYEQAEKEALQELKRYRNLALFTTALGIYWGEGDKATKAIIRVSNADAHLLQVWLAFLKHICGVPSEKVALAMYLYDDLNEEVCRRYWSKQLGVTKFHKTQILPSRHKSKRLPYGTCNVVVVNTYLKKKLLIWIDQLPEMVLNTVPQKRK